MLLRCLFMPAAATSPTNTGLFVQDHQSASPAVELSVCLQHKTCAPQCVFFGPHYSCCHLT
jgi:hypothetical protein